MGKKKGWNFNSKKVKLFCKICKWVVVNFSQNNKMVDLIDITGQRKQIRKKEVPRKF